MTIQQIGSIQLGDYVTASQLIGIVVKINCSVAECTLGDASTSPSEVTCVKSIFRRQIKGPEVQSIDPFMNMVMESKILNMQKDDPIFKAPPPIWGKMIIDRVYSGKKHPVLPKTASGAHVLVKDVLVEIGFLSTYHVDEAHERLRVQTALVPHYPALFPFTSSTGNHYKRVLSIGSQFLLDEMFGYNLVKPSQEERRYVTEKITKSLVKD